MKIVKTKLRAFTILEITVTMLIVSILASFIYYAFHTFSNILTEQQQKKRAEHDFDLFCDRVRWDSYQADSIKIQEEYILSFQDSLGIIEYQFLDDMVLRTQYTIKTDTFNVQAGFPLITEYHNGLQENNLVMAFELPLVTNDQTMLFLAVKKVYSARQLMGELSFNDKP